MTEPREIERTGELTRHPWPDDAELQGGKRGLVLDPRGNYRTAFVEVFAGTFLRGEGDTVADAEDAAWAKYQHMVSCPASPAHGPFEARKYTNGAGFCMQCGTWFSGVLPVQPPDPDRVPSQLERLIMALESHEQEGHSSSDPVAKANQDQEGNAV